MTNVYTDASSAILLDRTGLFDQFLVHTNVVMSESVYTEITKPGYPGEALFKAGYHNKQFRVAPCLTPNSGIVLESDLEPSLIKENSDLKQWGKGERDTIYLYLKNKDGYILIDDGKAARWCFKHEIPFINALLVPKLFWYSGLFSEKECISKTDELCTIGRYSNKVKTFAKGCTKQELSYFIEKLHHTKNSKNDLIL